jgi:2-C-methyl-D-erythritol 4-phosphate cytidylyltransferase/2-C-methyl-D-erythritol 2,4-cyclodiphosphate synthase
VALGLKALGGEYSHAVIHDGARPLATATDVTRVLDKALEQGAAILARRLPDTLKKEAGESGTVAETLPREGLWLAQTPQAFSVALLEEAMGKGDPSGATDEASLVEATGAKVAIVPGDGWNLKITDREDLAMAEALLGARDGARGPGRARGPAPSLSVGQGWDFHRFAPDRELYLGCVHFGGPPGLAGHSDADVLTHALIDAILGAACLGDIGQHFPDGSEAFRGASGRELLTLAWGMAGKDHAIENLDLTLIGESPRIAPRRLEIREALAAILGIPVSRVNLKGKTTEGMGFLGRGEGLAASAVALLSRKGRKRPPRRPRGPFG